MQYKTIILQLLEQRPEQLGRFQREGTLLATLERYAGYLKTRHEAWKDILTQARPGSDPSQLASEALESALRELEDSLPTASLPDESDALTLDGAMAFIRRRTPPG